MNEPKSSGMKPTRNLCVKVRGGEARGQIGVGWLNEDGSMSISLRPCAVISWNDDIVISLFPIREDG